MNSNTTITPPPVPQQNMTIEQAVAAAYAHWNAGQAPQAEHLCQQVLKIWPGHAGALHLMGLLAFTAGNRALAIQYLQKACDSPGAPAVFYSNLAEMLRQDSKLADAEDMARRAMSLDPTLAGAWTNLGIILQEAGKLEESLQCLQRALTFNPDSPENHNNLGNTCKRLGRIKEARTEYEEAVRLRPTYAEAHNNLGFLLNSLGEYEKALAEIRTAIDLSPQYADAYVNAAAVALAMGNTDEAMRWLNNLASFAPAHVAGLMARARTLSECGLGAEALDVARQAVAAAPQSGDAVELLAQSLSYMGCAVEALAMFDKAAALPAPQPESALISKSGLLGELGRMAEAEAAIDQALAINSRAVRAYFNRTSIHKYKAGEGDISRMEAMLGDDMLTQDDRIMLHFALGKAWSDAGVPDTAFEHWTKGNGIKRAGLTYDPAALEKWADSIAQTCNQSEINRLVRAQKSSDVPVFIVGMPRSGTSLVEQILASHAAVFGAGERKAMQQLADYTRGPDQKPVGFPRLVQTMSADDAEQLGHRYLGGLTALAPDKLRIVDKMPANFFYVGLIRHVLPGARIIHVQRDAMDSCFSCYTKLFAGEQRFSYDLTELGHFYRVYEKMMAHWRAVLPADRYMEIRYEDVVDDLEGGARRMLNFMGLDWDPACLRYTENPRQVRTASFAQVRQPLYRSSIGRWKPYARQLQPLADALGRAL